MSNLEKKASDYANAQFNHEIHSENVPNFYCTDLHEAFLVGYGVCQKEYEEKLRWIQVEERLPNEYDFVIAKSNLGDYYISSYSFNTFHVNMPFKVIITHWRQINIE